MDGSWEILADRVGSLSGSFNRPIGVVQEATADSEDGEFADGIFAGLSGLVTAIDIEFGAPAPNTVTITPRTVGGIPLKTATTLTESGRISLSPPQDIAAGLVLSMAGTGNNVNSAKFKAVAMVR